MKTMTEFIMEQEAPVTEELIGESFNENELVSQFMALQAASSNLNCMFEFATIANFCSENEITMPESLVQEGFGDTLKAIGKSIADWFKKIIEWFKGLIKGTASTFAKAKISETIAKLKQYDSADGNLPQDVAAKVKFVAHAAEILWGFMVKFKDVLKASMDAIDSGAYTSHPGSAESEYVTVMRDADEINTALQKFAKPKDWIDSTGKIKAEAFDVILEKSGITSEFSTTDDATVSVEALVKMLDKINKFNIPKKGTELMKQLDADTKKFTYVKAEHSRAERAAHPGDAAFDADDVARTSSNNKEARDKEMTKKINDMAKYLAKAYDEVVKKFSEITAKAVKDVEVGDKKKYDEDTKNAEKVAGTSNVRDISNN